MTEANIDFRVSLFAAIVEFARFVLFDFCFRDPRPVLCSLGATGEDNINDRGDNVVSMIIYDE